MVGRSFWARFRFAPLRYNDGTPCYFRAACLTVLALCLVAQGLVIGARKDAQSAQLAQAGENASSAQSLQQDQLTQGVSGTLQVGQSVSATVVGTSLSRTTVSAPISSHLAIAPNGTNAALAEHSLAATSSLSSAHVAPPRSELDVTLQPSGFWSMLGLSSDEDKLKAQLLKNRRAALVELLDSAAYFNSCGTINSSYAGCNYRFSKRLKALYDISVKADPKGYIIAITAKGEQAQDPCARFTVNAQGEYFAYDQNGAHNLKCFENTEVPKQIMAISQALQLLNSEGDEGSALAARP